MNRETDEDWDTMRNLSKEEVDIVFHIIYSGTCSAYLNMSNLNVISLLEKGVLEKVNACGGSPVFYLKDGLEDIAISLLYESETQRAKFDEQHDSM